MNDSQPINRSVAAQAATISVKFLNAAGTGFPEACNVPVGTTVEQFLSAPGRLQTDDFRNYILTVRHADGHAETPDRSLVLAQGDFVTATYQGQKGAGFKRI